MASAAHPPAVAATLAAWHRMIASGDLTTMDDPAALEQIRETLAG